MKINAVMHIFLLPLKWFIMWDIWLVGWLVVLSGKKKQNQATPLLPLSSSPALFWNFMLGSTGLCKSAEFQIAGKSLSYGEGSPGS